MSEAEGLPVITYEILVNICSSLDDLEALIAFGYPNGAKLDEEATEHINILRCAECTS